ncbi:MAG: hypothetical protein LBC79_03445 [Deltaproteobacteria bacterium]|jgi:hypothetical protein|nr:hypothetical protein [Deltaproteobacteria bacterium]
MMNMFLTGALVLVAFFVLVRILRRGRGRNYGESKKAFEERLRKTSAETRERTLSAGVGEQMLPVAAAVRELLDLAGNPPGFALLEEGRILCLQSPAGIIRVDFGLSRMRTALKHKGGHPQGRWRISGPGGEEKEYEELADAVAHLKHAISGGQKLLRDEAAGLRLL